MSLSEKDIEALEFVVDRLVHVYDESEHLDYISAARRAIVTARVDTRDPTYTNEVPTWVGKHEEIVVDVKVSVAIGLAFDEPWTEEEWRKAIEENAIDKISGGWGWLDPKNDLEWMILEVERPKEVS